MNDRFEIFIKAITSADRLQQRFSKYSSIPRDYGGNVVLYMREAHLISVLGNAGRMLSADELATSLEITHGAVTQLTDRLEKKGYVYREKSSDDKRLILRGLTEQGKKAYESHRAYDEKGYAYFFSLCGELSEEELQAFIHVADKFSWCFAKEISE